MGRKRHRHLSEVDRIEAESLRQVIEQAEQTMETTMNEGRSKSAFRAVLTIARKFVDTLDPKEE